MVATSSLLLLLAGGAAARTVQPRATSQQQAAERNPLFCTVGKQKALLNGEGRRRRQCTSVLSRLRGGAKEDDDKVEGDCIGIDLGTTYSCVGVWKNGRVEIIANDQGNRITPSYVAWTADDQRLIGDAAKNQATSNPENTVFDAKRLIGRKIDDPAVQADMKHWPFKVVEKSGKPMIAVDAKGRKEF